MNPYHLHGLRRVDDDLIMENVSLKKLAQKIPTPLYIYNEQVLIDHLEAYKNAFKSDRFTTQIFYASKAFNIKAMLELVNSLGLGVDVVSIGELYTALQAGFDKKNILFHGNNKQDEELSFALENEIGTIVIDNIFEAERLISMIRADQHIDTLIRLNPGIEAHTHEYVVTGHIDSKFGVSMLEMDHLIDLCTRLASTPGIHFRGFHCHIGSQITDLQAFEEEIKKLASFSADFQQKSGIQIDTIDLGGGFASWYESSDNPPAIDVVCKRLLDACSKFFDQNGLEIKNLYIEPGRSIVANAGITLYTIGDIKQTPNKKYYFIDGGMNDNIRPALYESRYTCELLESKNPQDTEIVTIAGKCCESGDMIAKDIEVEKARPKDHLITYATGAYGYSMASNYNKLGVPGVLFIRDGKIRQVVKPQTLEDLIRNETDQEIEL